MKQSRLESLVEAIVNTTIGLIITLSVYPLINWICGISMSNSQLGLSTLLFTVISVLRSFVIRRFFSNMYVFKHWIVDILKK